MIVACCNGCPYREYCGVPSHGSLSIVATHESGAASCRAYSAAPLLPHAFRSIPRLPLSRLQRARLPMRSHAHALLASALDSLIRIAATLIRIATTLIRIAATLIRIASTLFRIIGACVRHTAQHTTRRIHVAAAQAVPVQMWQRRGPVPVQMWRAQSRSRCGRSGVGCAAARTCSLSDRSGRAAPRARTSSGNTKQHTTTLC